MTRSLRTLLLTTTALAALGLPAMAGPDGAKWSAAPPPCQARARATVTINQISDRAIINWQHFNIGAARRTRSFSRARPRSRSIASPAGSDRPRSCGTLDANGRVFVVNRDGILFGPTPWSTPRASSPPRATSATTTSWRGATTSTFRAVPTPRSSTRARSRRTARGFAALVAPGVRNSGTITATLGKVGLAAGNTFTLDFYGDKLITLGGRRLDRRHGARRADRPADQRRWSRTRAGCSANGGARASSPPRPRARSSTR